MKESLVKPVYFVALVLSMLVAGVFWGTWFTLARSIETFSPAEFIHIGRTIIGCVAVPIRVIKAAVIVYTAITAWLYQMKRAVGVFLERAASILIIVTLISTLLVLGPIDNQIRSWTVSKIPPPFN